MEKIVLSMPSLSDELEHVREFFKRVKMKNREKYDLSVGQFNIIYPQLYRSYKHLIRIDCVRKEIIFFYAKQTETNKMKAQLFHYFIRFFAMQFKEKLDVQQMTFRLIARKEYK